MAMTCWGILALPYANRLRLVAGASGGGNEIRWVHILEEPKYTAWLKGGELILLSGVVTGDREGALLSLLQDLFDREVAGVVLNLSTFLPAIPPSVLALGDRLGLPLFEMPVEVRMVDVSQSIAFAIFQQRQKTGQVEGALRDLLTGKRLSERRLQRLAEVGLGGGRTFRAVLFRPGLPGTPLPVTPFYEEETEEAWLAQGAAYLRQVLDRLGDPGYPTVAGETILWLAEDPPGRPAALPQRLEAADGGPGPVCLLPRPPGGGRGGLSGPPNLPGQRRPGPSGSGPPPAPGWARNLGMTTWWTAASSSAGGPGRSWPPWRNGCWAPCCSRSTRPCWTP